MLPPIICRSNDMENKKDATDGANALIPDPTACAKPFVAPKAAPEGALFTIIIWIEPSVAY